MCDNAQVDNYTVIVLFFRGFFLMYASYNNNLLHQSTVHLLFIENMIQRIAYYLIKAAIMPVVLASMHIIA